MISTIIPNTETYEIEKQIQVENDTEEQQISLNNCIIEENKNAGKNQMIFSKKI